MTRRPGRPLARTRWVCSAAALTLCALLVGGASDAVAKRKPAAKRASAVTHVARQAPADDAQIARPLSYSEEFDRAELIERMLTECRGVSYNAYELAQTSGESLWLPAPIQLMVVRVRHPYCAELLRTYAPKLRV